MIRLFVIAHGAVGALALTAGTVAVLTAKGSVPHRRAGRWFAAAMTVSLCLIAVPIVIKFNVFMMTLGGIAGYALFLGLRSLQRFRNPTLPFSWVDWVVAAACVAGALGLGWLGARVALSGRWGMGGMCLGFAFGGFMLVRTQWQRANDPPSNRRVYLADHAIFTTIAYMAAVTAFVIVNFEAVLGSWQWIGWAGPTAIGVPWMLRSARRIRGEA